MDSALFGAIAACAAALLSGLTLAITALRDERKWRRDAIVDILADFFDGSFERPGNHAFRAIINGRASADYRNGASQAHAKQIRALTRLRLLADKTVVGKAVELFDIENRIHEALFGESLPSEIAFMSLYEERRQARAALLVASRRSLGLGASQGMEAGLHRVLPSPHDGSDKG